LTPPTSRHPPPNTSPTRRPSDLLPVILPAKHTAQVFAELEADRLPGRVFRLLRVRPADELNVKSDLLGISCLNREIAEACQKQQIGRAHVNSSHLVISYAVFCLK